MSKDDIKRAITEIFSGPNLGTQLLDLREIRVHLGETILRLEEDIADKED